MQPGSHCEQTLQFRRNIGHTPQHLGPMLARLRIRHQPQFKPAYIEPNVERLIKK